MTELQKWCGILKNFARIERHGVDNIWDVRLCKFVLSSWPTDVVLTHWWLSRYRNFLCRITAAGKWNHNHLCNRKGLKHFQTTDLTGMNIWATFINNLMWSSVMIISLNLDQKAFSCMQHKWLLIYVMVNKGSTTVWTSWPPFQPKTSKS